MKLEIIAALVVAAAASPANPKYSTYQRYWPHPYEAEIEQRATPPRNPYCAPNCVDKRDAKNGDIENYNAYQPHPKRDVPRHGVYKWYDPPVKRAESVSTLVNYETWVKAPEDDPDLARRAEGSSALTNYETWVKAPEDDPDLSKRGKPSATLINYETWVKASEDDPDLAKRGKSPSALIDYEAWVKAPEDDPELTKRAKSSSTLIDYEAWVKAPEDDPDLARRAEGKQAEGLTKRINPNYGNYANYNAYSAVTSD